MCYALCVYAEHLWAMSVQRILVFTCAKPWAVQLRMMVGLCRTCTGEMLFAAKSENTRSPQSCPQFQYYIFAANVTCISQFHYKISGRRFMCYDLHLLWHFSPFFVAFEHYFIDGIIIIAVNAERMRKMRANSFGSLFICVNIGIVMVCAICVVCVCVCVAVYAIALAFTHCLPFVRRLLFRF